MQTTGLNTLCALATLPHLPERAFRVLLAGKPDRLLRKAAAGNPDLPADLRHALCADKDPDVRRTALRHTTDLDRLTDAARGGYWEILGACANPRTDPALLADWAAGDSDAIARAAMTNPSTPDDAVLDAADRVHSTKFLTGANRCHTEGRIGLIVDAHPILARRWAASRNATVRRVVARMPHLDADAAHTLRMHHSAGGPGAAMRNLTLNPFVPAPASQATVNARTRHVLDDIIDGLDLDNLASWPGEKLAGAGSIGSETLDLLAAKHGARAAWPAMLGRGVTKVAADALAWMADNAGPDMAWAIRRSAGPTRVRAAAALHGRYAPVLENGVTPITITPGQLDADPTPLATAAGILGDRTDAWTALVPLAEHWDGTLQQLAEVAAGVGQGSRAA